jgi:hypothetical protein
MYRKTICLAFSLLLILFQIIHAKSYPGQLGVGVGFERGGTFVDLVKENYRWARTDWSDLQSGDVDSQGWPTRDAIYIYDSRPCAEWEGLIDDPDVYRVDLSGTYKCSFIGRAKVSALAGGKVWNKWYDSGTNTTKFDFEIDPPGPNHGLFFIQFEDTQRTPASPIDSGFTNFKMIRPGYPADTTQTFHQPLLDALASVNFAAIRFINFTGADEEDIIYPDTTEWSERKLTTDASQSRINALNKWECAAWEYVIELSNIVKIDPWINVPVSASTDYVTQLATMLRDNLDPTLNIYVESSNEVWNSVFHQQAWNAAQAAALGINEHENHARRTVELAQIFESVFGAGSLNNRIRVMLCCHAPMLKWWVEEYMIPYINSHYPGQVKDYIYSIARQTYFGGESAKGQPGTENYTVEQILDECHNDIISQIWDSGLGENGRRQWVNKAAQWQLVGGCCSYEGGTDFMGTDWSDYPHSLRRNIANRIRAVRDPRMADELKFNYAYAFFDIGGNLAMDLALSSGYCRYGCWGLTDDITNPDRNYQFQAFRELTCETVIADINGDCKVNFTDFALLANEWLKSN